MRCWFFYKRFFYFCTGIIFLLQTAKAQYAEKDFVHYTVKDGLSDNFVTGIQQDGQGYMWIGTDVGLNRFDGNSFKNFYQGSTVIPLQASTVSRLKIFKPGHLGILTKGGFQLLDTRTFSLQNFYIADSTAFSSQRNTSWDAMQLPDGSFAVTSAAGFQVYSRSGKVIFLYDAYSLKDIGKKRILYGRDIFKLNDKEYLVYVEETGLAYYNHEKKIFRQIDPGDKMWSNFSHPVLTSGVFWTVKYQLTNNQFIFIPRGKDSILFYDHHLKRRSVSRLPDELSLEITWESKIRMLNDSVFIINGGRYGFYLFHLDMQTGYITTDGKKLMPDFKITSIFLDKNKRLWLGTSAGLLKQKLNTPLISAHRYPNPPGQTGNLVTTYSHKNKLYAGRFSWTNGGLSIINPGSMQVEKHLQFYGGNNRWNEVLSIQMYHPDTLWIGTSEGVLWLDTETNSYGKLLKQKDSLWLGILAPVNKDGYAWMCSYLGGLVMRYHVATRSFTKFSSQTKPALPFDKVKNIAYDSYGDVWIGGHSLTRWNSRKQLFDTLITVYAGANKFKDDIRCISADANGSLWIHNANNGLLEYRVMDKKFIAYSMNDGLPSEVVKSLSPVIDNILWIGSHNHLTRFDTRTKKMVIYDHLDGLPESRPTGVNIDFDKAGGVMYMCNNEYLVKFPFEQNNSFDSSSGLMIQELIVNNRKNFFQPADKMNLKYNENNLTLNFTVIDFEKTNYQFAYRVNNDDNWHVLGLQRSLSLNNLQPGNYNIRIKATGRSGNERIQELAITIEPPYWKTTWFLIMISFVSVATFYFLYRNRIRRIRQKADIDRLLAQTEMKALHAQMNPHFIFNSLNSIREMILNNENKEASHFLSKFAHLIRITLDQSGQTFISLRNTVDYLERYIEMEQIRNNHFTCNIKTDEALDMDETILPPMLIQPFIENAIWHGASGKRRDIVIKVEFKKDGDNMTCTIDDNGIGVNQSLKNKPVKQVNHKPVGIANIENRIKLLNEKYELHSTIRITDKKDLPGAGNSGTIVILQLPLEIKET